MRTGATDVYSRREEIPGIDTALMILIDGSSSMDYAENKRPTSRMDIAQTAAWHISRAAEAANAKVAVCVFHGLNNSTTN
jgi:Mg-chelatase subunit ChlD